MIFKSTLLAVILLLGVLSIAKAQSKGGEAVGEGQLRSDEVTTEAVLGWNYIHVTTCYADGTAFYVFPPELSINYIFTSNPLYISLLAPACQTGNYVGVFVTSVSGSSFSWNQLVSFTFK
jgi:hypothetical protein